MSNLEGPFFTRIANEKLSEKIDFGFEDILTARNFAQELNWLMAKFQVTGKTEIVYNSN